MGFSHQLDLGRKGNGGVELGSRYSQIQEDSVSPTRGSDVKCGTKSLQGHQEAPCVEGPDPEGD